LCFCDIFVLTEKVRMGKSPGDKETMRRVDEALKRAFQMPHKPHVALGCKTKRKSKTTRKTSK
jgi:hypothetical protein